MFFGFHFPFLSSMDNNNAYFIGLFCGLHKLTQLKNLELCLAQFLSAQLKWVIIIIISAFVIIIIFNCISTIYFHELIY